MEKIVELIDAVLMDPESEPNIKKVRKKVNELVEKFPLYK